MAQIKEYFATDKIAPQDRGVEAFEQAGRRVGAYAEQTAQGDQQVGKDISELWQTAKFGVDALADKGRGTVGLRGGKASDALDFGARSNWGNGIEAGAYGQNENTVSGYGTGGSRSFNSRAANGIGGAAASLPTLISRLAEGQGLTDQQYQELGRKQGKTPAGGFGLNTDEKAGGIAPNPVASDEDAAKAGFNTGQQYDAAPPSFPLDRGGSGLPDILGMGGPGTANQKISQDMSGMQPDVYPKEDPNSPWIPAASSGLSADNPFAQSSRAPAQPGAISNAASNVATSASEWWLNNVGQVGGLAPVAGAPPAVGTQIWNQIRPLVNYMTTPTRGDGYNSDGSDPNADADASPTGGGTP